MFAVTHSCGDCGFLGRGSDFDRHHQRKWHRLVMRSGLDAVLDSSAAKHPDARRAVAIFREGAKP